MKSIGTFVPKIKTLYSVPALLDIVQRIGVEKSLGLWTMGRGGIIFWRAGGPQSEIQTIFSFIS
jgi:hypothetical protein